MPVTVITVHSCPQLGCLVCCNNFYFDFVRFWLANVSFIYFYAVTCYAQCNGNAVADCRLSLATACCLLLTNNKQRLLLRLHVCYAMRCIYVGATLRNLLTPRLFASHAHTHTYMLVNIRWQSAHFIHLWFVKHWLALFLKFFYCPLFCLLPKLWHSTKRALSFSLHSFFCNIFHFRYFLYSSSAISTLVALCNFLVMCFFLSNSRNLAKSLFIFQLLYRFIFIFCYFLKLLSIFFLLLTLIEFNFMILKCFRSHCFAVVVSRLFLMIAFVSLHRFRNSPHVLLAFAIAHLF